MAAIEWTDVEAGDATFSAVGITERIFILAYVNARFVPGVGTEASTSVKSARVYLARHMGSVCLTGGGTGAVIAESEGGLSRAYAAGDASTWGSTMWGKLLNSVLRSSPARAGFLCGE